MQTAPRQSKSRQSNDTKSVRATKKVEGSPKERVTIVTNLKSSLETEEEIVRSNMSKSSTSVKPPKRILSINIPEDNYKGYDKNEDFITPVHEPEAEVQKPAVSIPEPLKPVESLGEMSAKRDFNNSESDSEDEMMRGDEAVSDTSGMIACDSATGLSETASFQ